MKYEKFFLVYLYEEIYKLTWPSKSTNLLVLLFRIELRGGEKGQNAAGPQKSVITNLPNLSN